jgi:hypothetical protein
MLKSSILSQRKSPNSLHRSQRGQPLREAMEIPPSDDNFPSVRFPFSEIMTIFAPPYEALRALVAELVDAPDLGSGCSRSAGSSPVRRTLKNAKRLLFNRLAFLLSINCYCFCYFSPNQATFKPHQEREKPTIHRGQSVSNVQLEIYLTVKICCKDNNNIR